MRGRTIGIGVAGLAVLVIAACSSGTGTRSTASSGSDPLGSGASASAVDKVGAPEPADANSGGGGGTAQYGTGSKASTLLDSRSLIRTASISVRIPTIDLADRVRTIATAAGGQVDGDDRTSGDNATATMVLEVPPNALADVLTRISGLGKELGRQLSTKDVTTQVADVNSRVTSAKDSIARLRLLFTKAEKIGDIIALENELSAREADLESLQAQQRTLAAQTEMAQVTVDLSTAGPVTKKHDQRGFIGGIKRGWDNFVDATVSVLTGLGIAGPFALFAVIVLGAGLVVLRRRRAAATTAGVTAETS